MVPVWERLKERGVHVKVLPHTRVYSAEDEAEKLHVPASEVVKSVALTTHAGHALAIIPASRRLDLKLLREATGDHSTRLATEEEIERDFPDYELGALPPLGSLLPGVTIYLDPEVITHAEMVFAGSQTESVQAPTSEVLAGEQGTIAPISDRGRLSKV